MQAFAGTDRHVADYLVDEVLARQSSALQEFLLQTSILERLSGPLCDAVVGEEGDSQSILEYLEQANLFVVPLDNQRVWYRYHHLFAEMLRAKLRRVFPHLITSLHVRAADWCEKHGLIAEAVDHALAARAWERAADWVAQNARDLLAQGQIATVMSWTAALPKDTASSRPRLCIELAWALAYANRLEEVELWLRNTERALEAGWDRREDRPPVLSEAEERLIRANVALLRAYLTLVIGNPAHALELGHLARTLLPEEDPLSSGCAREFANLYWLFGYAYRTLSDPIRAADSFAEAVRLGKAAGDLWHTMLAMTDLGMIYRYQGRLAKAAATFHAIFQYADKNGILSHGYLGRVEANLALVLLDQNKLDEALHHARQGVALTQSWQSSNHMAWAYAVLVRVLTAHGNLQEADRAIQNADQARRGANVLPGVASFVEATQVRLWLQQGNLAAAGRWADELRKTLGDVTEIEQATDENLEMKLIALARILIAEGRETNEPALFENASNLLNRLQDAAVHGKRIRSLLEIGALQAIALFLQETSPTRRPSRSGEVSMSLAVLEHALRLAEPEGYIRVFVDEGQPMAEMLYQAAAHVIMPEYCGRLLAAFTEVNPTQPSSKTSSEELIEPLSEREEEVLRLIADGSSNADVAAKLYISLNTVKGHTRSIYGKLGVNSRTQAVASARALGLLPPE